MSSTEQPLEQACVDEPPNAIHDRTGPEASWSSVNLAEAVPGVMTPLCWSLWSPAAEAGIRAPFYGMGALSRRERRIPDRYDDRIVKVFFGRQAVRVDAISRIGDRVPGQSGAGLARDVFGFVPPNYVPEPSWRRAPVIAARYPWTFARMAARVRALRGSTEAWWRGQVARAASADLTAARAMFTEATDRFALVLGTQATIIACCIQPIYDQVSKLARSVGVDGNTLMTGHGSHEETAAIGDLWRVSRGTLSESEFLARHGFHGSAAGELSSVVWREAPEQVRGLVAGYRGRGEDADPVLTERRRAAERVAAEREFLARLPAARRGPARLLLALAARYLPLRGVAKVSYLQSIDVARAAARRAGALLVDRGVLDEVDDVFHLTSAELLGEPPAQARALVAQRRALRTRYAELDVPASFTGQPVATVAVDAVAVDAVAVDCASGSGAAESAGSRSAGSGPAGSGPVEDGADRIRLEGVGASPGVVRGRAVVLSDPTEADIDDEDIIVAHTTDPAWASVMFLSRGLVVDIGGMLSHAAVVAREIGVPCVMNTRNGTRVLRTGDRIEVDGTAGTVRLLERAATEQ